MSIILTPDDIPLALYVHVPWCVKKCPYCDFNSHQTNLSQPDYAAYVDALLADAKSQIPYTANRSISSVFFGGGTPSLLPANELFRLLDGLRCTFSFTNDCEITLEANPGTLEHAPFSDYLNAGVNRLSIGVQSFSPPQLASLGRIHNTDEAQQAIFNARNAGFYRVNVDIMHGLANQSVHEALYDLTTAIDCGATHISWYQLTIEPNTVFFRQRPKLPEEGVLSGIQAAGEALLKASGFSRYEVSAWVSAQDTPCKHNQNYWQFGDYLAIGAGAHGKVTLTSENVPFNVAGVYRFSKSRLPKDYLAQIPAKMVGFEIVKPEDLAFEFMMNALRLDAGVASKLFEKRTGLKLDAIEEQLSALAKKQLISEGFSQQLVCTQLGKKYLNQVLNHFA